MGDHESPAVADHVELDDIDTRFDRSAERRERVLGCERRCPAVADTERTRASSFKRDHGLGLVGR
jgi:hypothetical protein